MVTEACRSGLSLAPVATGLQPIRTMADLVVTAAIALIDQTAESCCSNVWWMQAWLVPLGDEAECVGAAVHSGFRASWHSGLRQLVNDLVSGMMASGSNQAGHMRVLITGQARTCCHTPCCLTTCFTNGSDRHLARALQAALAGTSCQFCI